MDAILDGRASYGIHIAGVTRAAESLARVTKPNLLAPHALGIIGDLGLINPVNLDPNTVAQLTDAAGLAVAALQVRRDLPEIETRRLMFSANLAKVELNAQAMSVAEKLARFVNLPYSLDDARKQLARLVAAMEPNKSARENLAAAIVARQAAVLQNRFAPAQV